MDGVYVNSENEMVLVRPLRVNKEHGGVTYSVHGLGWDMVVDASTEGKVVTDSSKAASFDGEDCISWNDEMGDWHRVKMSHAQYRVLTSKPYFPVTLVAVFLLGSTVKFVFDRARNVLAYLWWKKTE